jgi:hypothetical protein
MMIKRRMRRWCGGWLLLIPTAGTLGWAFPGKGRLGWGGDKKEGIGVGEGNLGDVVTSAEPVRSHAGINVAGPPTCKSNAGGRRKKVEECGDIRGGGGGGGGLIMCVI